MPRILPYVLLALLSLATLEVVLRLMSVVDADSNITFRSTRLKPYRLPVNHLEKSLAAYTRTGKSGPVYDPELGWALRPDVYDHNEAGFITTGPLPEKNPHPDRLRIALVGDSYTQGNYQWGWWRVLEQNLNAAGIPAEVLNFGVSGYGTDQAYLRLRRDALAWQPHVVVYGFMADSCTRNLNLFRVLRDSTTGIPFMKPRFILEGEGLKLINAPTPSPQDLLTLARDITRWDCLKYEYFHYPEDYQMRPWRWSRLGAVLEARWTERPDDLDSEHFYSTETEGGQIALRIIRRMEEESRGAGAKFLLLSLPSLIDLERLRGSAPLPQQAILDAVEKEFAIICPEKRLLKEAEGREISDFFAENHYLSKFDAIVGETIAKVVEQRAKSTGKD